MPILQHEVSICRKEQPYEIDIRAHQLSLQQSSSTSNDLPTSPSASTSADTPSTSSMEVKSAPEGGTQEGKVAESAMETDAGGGLDEGASTSAAADDDAWAKKVLVKLPNGKCKYCQEAVKK